MPILDRIRSLIGAISNGPYDNNKATESNLANGGHTGYRPPKKQPKQRQSQTQTPPQSSQYANDPSTSQSAYQQNMQGSPQGYAPTYTQSQMMYNNPYGAPSAAPDASQVWGLGWQGQGQGTGQQPSWGTSWQADPQQAMYTGGMSSANMSPDGYPPVSNRTNPQDAQRSQNGQASQFGQSAPFVQASQASQSQPMGQLHFMPGQYVHEGRAYTHVERIATPLSAASCFRLIDFMRNGESIVVNTERITDERENTHCLDLLYGAAFTMGYTFTKISEKRIFLISPATVCVLPYGTIKTMTDEELARRWPGSYPEQVQQGQPAGFDFDSIDRKFNMNSDSYGQQRRYS